MSAFITSQNVDTVVSQLRRSGQEADSAASQLNAAADAAQRAAEALQREQSRPQPSYDPANPYASRQADNSYQLQSLQNRLDAARAAEEAAAGRHQQAMQGLDGARHSANDLLGKVREKARDAENDARNLQHQARQIKGSQVRSEVGGVQKGVQFDLATLEKFRKRLEEALAAVRSAGANVRRSSGGSPGGLEQRIGGSGGFSGANRSRSYDFNPAEVYGQSRYASVDSQLAANPYKGYGSPPSYGSSYQSTLNGLGRYW